MYVALPSSKVPIGAGSSIFSGSNPIIMICIQKFKLNK